MIINNLNNALDSTYNELNNNYEKMTLAVKNNPETTTKVLLTSGVAIICMLNAENIRGIASKLFCDCNYQVVCNNIAPKESLSFFANPISTTIGTVSNAVSSVTQGVQSAFDALCNTVTGYIAGTATGLLLRAGNHAQVRLVQQQPPSFTRIFVEWFFSR